ncbi:deoxyribose-phosphate aldolase [bacterium]|nr:deoxyribose-phosphate aldolase [bacterium]
MDLNNLNVAKYIDHTLLKPQSVQKDIDKLCDEAKTYNFKAVCVNSYWTKRSKENLKGTDILIATVVGFPLGAMTTEAKAFETNNAVENGSHEIDMVINIGELKAGNYEAVQKDIEAVVAAADGKTVKVIIETCLLTDEEKVKACILSKNAKANFVKTSTGFSTGGATLEDIYLMRQTVGKEMGVKASGGVRDYDTAIKMIENGATRIGTSSGIKIVTGEKGGTNERY